MSCILCLIASRRGAADRVFWVGSGLLMIALGVNKQLDLQSALTALGRCTAQLQGWYQDRRAVQMVFILVLLGVFLLIAVGMFWRLRSRLRRIWLALLGLCCLLSFMAIRATSFHHFDALIGTRINNIPMNWILELGGIGMILMNAAFQALGPGAQSIQPSRDAHR